MVALTQIQMPESVAEDAVTPSYGELAVPAKSLFSRADIQALQLPPLIRGRPADRRDLPFAVRLTRDRNGQEVFMVNLARMGKHVSKTFSPHRYGTLAAAQAAAIAYRDQLLADMPPMSRRECNAIVRSNNTSGVPGVTLKKGEGRGSWLALIHWPDGSKERRSFAIGKYGNDEAFEMAVAARKDMLERAQGWMAKHPQSAPPKHMQVPAIEGVCVLPTSARPQPNKQQRLIPVGVRVWTYSTRSADGQPVPQRRWVVEHSQDGVVVKRKTFCVKRHGEELAKELALEQYALWQLAPPEPATKKRNRYLAGPGGRVTVYRLPEQGGEHPSWVVRLYKPNGERVLKQFSVNRHGEEEARQMALGWQTRWVQG